MTLHYVGFTITPWRMPNEFSGRDACAKDELLQPLHLLVPVEGHEFYGNRPFNTPQQSREIPDANSHAANYQWRLGHLVGNTEKLPQRMVSYRIVFTAELKFGVQHTAPLSRSHL